MEVQEEAGIMKEFLQWREEIQLKQVKAVRRQRAEECVNSLFLSPSGST